MSVPHRHSPLQRAAIHRYQVALLTVADRFLKGRGRTPPSREDMNALPRLSVRGLFEPGRVSRARHRVAHSESWLRQTLRRPGVRIGSTFPACPNFDTDRQD